MFFTRDDPDKVIETSMVRLLALPWEYNGKIVRVTGFYQSSGFESSELYLSRDDARIWNLPHSFFLTGVGEKMAQKMSHHYVAVSGRFQAHGETGCSAGIIEEVVSIRFFDEESNTWMRLEENDPRANQ